MKQQVSLALAALVLAACAEPTSVPTQAEPEIAPAAVAAPEPIPGQYIVVLKGPAEPRLAAQNLVSRFNGQLRYVYTSAIRGFAAKLSDEAVQVLRSDPGVAYVEQDQRFTVSGTQTGATWGLDRIDQRNLPLSTTYTETNTGAGVTAYIIDTGINYSHSEFGGRASKGIDAVTANGTAADCHGHGTHVAGTVGGATYGVAKSVALVAVRVLDCAGSGSNSGVIAGVDWVTANHVSPAVANMSLGGGASTALDNAVANSIASGVTYGVAAGNGNFVGIAQDACKSSPARTPSAITVSATDKTDKKASFANYGSCVDIFAPGVGITSAWYSSNTATNTISGTSMATPHVVGAAALYLQSNPSATPLEVRDALVANATLGKVTSSKTTNPALLFVNY